MKVVLLPQAQEDLDSVFEPLLSRIVRRLEILREFPDLGAPMAGPFSGHRSTVVGMFRIVYRLLPPDMIEVAYIRNCRRQGTARAEMTA
ncbi:MAG: type II toxin-antitoxin system RelE/ParE family toxin [Elusimicrobia bacterium]|nr:type II toxin-antitoxin system RelE/ParE family toxin [Elusimicrobiota bacterium]